MSGPLRMGIRVQGLLNQSEFRGWERDWKARQRRQVADGMAEWGRSVTGKIRTAIPGAMKTTGLRVARSIKYRVFASKPERQPAVLIYSKIPWLGMHTEGGTVQAKGGGLLIPLLTKRMGAKAFKAVVTRILQTGAGFFKKVGSSVILFAEYQPEYGKPLARFRREYRTATGAKRIKAGADIPIAVLVKGVTLRKRLDFDGIVTRNLDDLAAAIERRLEL